MQTVFKAVSICQLSFPMIKKLPANALQGCCCISNEMQLQHSHMKKDLRLGFRAVLLVEVVLVTSEIDGCGQNEEWCHNVHHAFGIESSPNQWSFRNIRTVAVVDDEVNVEEVLVVALCGCVLTTVVVNGKPFACKQYQWSFLVPLTGGRYHIITQLAIGSIYHLYTTYVLPIGWLYGTYHLLREPETAIYNT